MAGDFKVLGEILVENTGEGQIQAFRDELAGLTGESEAASAPMSALTAEFGSIEAAAASTGMTVEELQAQFATLGGVEVTMDSETATLISEFGSLDVAAKAAGISVEEMQVSLAAAAGEEVTMGAETTALEGKMMALGEAGAGVQGAMAGMGKALMGGLVLMGVVKVTKDLTKAGEDEQAQMVQLNAALNQNARSTQQVTTAGVAASGRLAMMGKSTSDVTKATVVYTGMSAEAAKSVDEWTQKFGEQYGVMNSSLLPAFATLFRATGNVTDAQKLMMTAQDIAAAKGIDLAAVAKALAKAQQGTVTGLARYGIVTKDASGKTMTFTNIMKNAVKTYGGDAQKAADTTTGKVRTMQVTFSHLKDQIGPALLPVINGLVTVLGGAVKVFMKLPGPVKDGVVIVGLLTAALVGLGMIIGPLKAGFEAMAIGEHLAAIASGIWTAATWVATAAQTAWDAALAATGLPLLIVIITAVIAVVVLLIKHWKDVEHALVAAWNAIKAAAVAVWDWLVAAFKKWGLYILVALTGPIGLLVVFLLKNWTQVKTDALNVWNTIMNFIQKIPGRILGFFGDAATLLWDVGRNIMKGLWDGAISIWKDVVGWFKGIGHAIASAFGGGGGNGPQGSQAYGKQKGGTENYAKSGELELMHGTETVVAHDDPSRGLADLAAAGILGGGKGGDTYYNLTIHTTAPHEPIVTDFAMMRAVHVRGT